jgi:hypothetical protein
MSIKSKLLAGAAALTMVSGVGIAATAGTAMAGTPSCGHDCINLWQVRYGTAGFFNPQFVTDVYKQIQKVGTPIIEFRASNADPAEDWTVAAEGNVSEFYAAGLVSADLAIHYGCGKVTGEGSLTTCAVGADDLYAFENEYAPFGADSGLCMGLAATAVTGEQVTLQPCGVSSKTLWIPDLTDWNFHDLYGVAMINGSDTNFSHPFVLTYTGEPTAMPRASAFVSNLTGFSAGNGIFNAPSSIGTIPDSQQWVATPGVLP